MHTSNQAHQQMISAWQAQARNKPWLTLSFAAIILIIMILLMVSIYQGIHLDNFYYALSGGLAGFVATAGGALLIFFGFCRRHDAGCQCFFLDFARY